MIAVEGSYALPWMTSYSENEGAGDFLMQVLRLRVRNRCFRFQINERTVWLGLAKLESLELCPSTVKAFVVGLENRWFKIAFVFVSVQCRFSRRGSKRPVLNGSMLVAG